MREATESELYAAWRFNCDALLCEILVWKKEYISKQRKKNPNISDEELIKKIKKAKYQKFRHAASFLITNHPLILCGVFSK